MVRSSILQRVVLSIVGLLAFSSGSLASDVAAVPDRNRLPLGEEFRIKLTVRRTLGRATIKPPSVPGCRIEPIKAAPPSSSTSVRSSPTAGKQGSSKAAASLIDGIGNLESQVRKSLAEQTGSQGLNDPLFGADQQDLLRAYREQAMRALQGSATSSNTKDHEVLFRVVPSRSGILTVPSFIVEAGGKTFLTRPIEVTVDEARQDTAAAPSAPAGPHSASTDGATATEPSPPAATSDEPTIPRYQSLLHQARPWLLPSLAVLCGLVVLFPTARRWRRWRDATAQARGQRHAAKAARGQVLQRLHAAAPPEAIADALTGYLRSRCTLPPGEITPAEAAQALEAIQVSAPLADRFAALLEGCTAARYAAGGVAVAEQYLATEARQLINEITRSGK